MDKSFKIAVMLSAYDKMSTVINGAVDKASTKLKALQKTGEKYNKAGNQMLLAGAVGTGALTYALKQAADQEKMQIALTTAFQGNEKAAADAFTTINKYAAQTPYEMQDVMGAFIKLKNMGLDPSEKALTAYGNTASSMGKDLNQMIEAVADAATFQFERLRDFGIRASQHGDKVTFLFQGVKTTVAKNSKAIEAYLQNIGNKKFAGGIEAQSKSISGQLSTLKDNFNMSAAAVGKVFIPMLNSLFQKITPFVAKMQTWIEKNPELAKVLGFVAVALTVVGAATKAVGVIMMANPIIFIITGIATAAYLIYKNWDKIKAWFQRLWNNVKAIFSNTWQWIKKMFLNYTPAGLIIKHWDKIAAWFSNLWQKVKDVFSSVWEWIKNLFLNYTPIGLVYKHWDEIVQYFTNIWEKVKNVFKNAWASIKKGLKSFFSGGSSDVEAIKEQYAASLQKNINVNIGGSPAGGINNAPAPLATALQPNAVNNNKNTYQFAPVINYNGPGGPAAGQQIASDVVKQMQAFQANKLRTQF